MYQKADMLNRMSSKEEFSSQRILYLLTLLDTQKMCSCFLIHSTNGELQTLVVKQLDIVNQCSKAKYTFKEIKGGEKIT